jgi:hypothetical protein
MSTFLSVAFDDLVFLTTKYVAGNPRQCMQLCLPLDHASVFMLACDGTGH